MPNFLPATAGRLSRLAVPLRFIIFHLHPTSARLRFLLFQSQLCAPYKLPALSDLLELAPDTGDEPTLYPATYLKRLVEEYALPRAQLKVQADLRFWVDTPSGPLPVYGVRAAGEQPFQAPSGCQWIELPDCHPLRDIDKLLMRALYTKLLTYNDA